MRHDLGQILYFLYLPVIPDDMGDEKRVTFRADPDKIDYLDDQIRLAKLEDRLDDEISRSDLLRQCVDDLIKELEPEGNRDSVTVM